MLNRHALRVGHCSSSYIWYWSSSLICILAYFFLYRYFYIPKYASMGHIDVAPSYLEIAVAISLCILGSGILLIFVRHTSQIVLWYLYHLVGVPMQIVPLLSGTPPFEYVFLFNIVIVLSFTIALILTTVPIVNLPQTRLSERDFSWILFFVSFFLLLIVLRYEGIKPPPNPLDVYFLRDEYITSLKERGITFINYLARWLMYAWLPATIVFGFAGKRYWLILFGILGELYIYSVSGFKTSLFFVALLPIILLLLKRTSKQCLKSLTVGVLLIPAILIVGILLDVLVPDLYLSTFVRRAFMTPGLLSGYYLDYFIKHPIYLLTDTSLSRWFPPPYTDPAPLIIGQAYFGTPAPYANCNLFAHGFASLGWFGPVWYGSLLGIILRLYDSISHHRPRYFTIGLWIAPLVVILNSDLITSLVGHGVGWIFLIAWLKPKHRPLEAAYADMPHNRNS